MLKKSYINTAGLTHYQVIHTPVLSRQKVSLQYVVVDVFSTAHSV
jgi:hypothetical protein